MDVTEIAKYLTALIEQSLAGQDIEHPKMEFKRQWYNLKDPKQIAAFVKDTTAMANTVGLDGFIVLGYDEKEKTFYPAKFSDSNLKDSSELSGIILKNVDRAFNLNYYTVVINENSLNVLHIPPSLDKPHVIRNHRSWPKNDDQVREERHRVFVRRNTKIEEATRYDFDFMQYDNKNIIPDYRVYAFISYPSLKFGLKAIAHSLPFKTEKVSAGVWITLENAGKRPISVGGMELILLNDEDSFFPKTITFTGYEANSTDVIIKPQELATNLYQVLSEDLLNMDFQKTKQFFEKIETSFGIEVAAIIHTNNRVTIEAITSSR